MDDYEDLKAKIQSLRAAGRIPSTPTREQRIAFAYGNTKIGNTEITREMAVQAVDANDERVTSRS